MELSEVWAWEGPNGAVLFRNLQVAQTYVEGMFPGSGSWQARYERDDIRELWSNVSMLDEPEKLSELRRYYVI